MVASIDEMFMRRCFDLASLGRGLTRTNPMVGCVIVHDGKIIGEGYHHEYGGPHAEVVALRRVKDKSLLATSTMYVNLEPCSHFGKTPPCSTLIINSGIPRVVISNIDPFPGVSGRGVESLRNAGIEVTTGVLKEKGELLNRRFLTFHRMKRPYIVLKWAQTSDGFIDVIRKTGDPAGINWITDEIARTLVHKWRSEEAGLMVGTDTILADNPKLNVRRWTGISPLRITFDRNGRIPENSNILDGSQDTLIFTCLSEKYSGKTKCVLIDHDFSIEDILLELYEQKVLSVMVEGGRKILQTFIDTGTWDEARVFKGSKSFNDGIPAPELGISPYRTVKFRNSDLSIHYNFSWSH